MSAFIVCLTFRTVSEIISLEKLKMKDSELAKQYNREYYLKNKEILNQKRLKKYYEAKYTEEQLCLIQKLKPHLDLCQIRSC